MAALSPKTPQRVGAPSFTPLAQTTKPRLNGCWINKGNPNMPIFAKVKEQVPCTVEVSHRFESLHAHVRFNNGAVVHPGDEVLVHGAPVLAAYGEVVIEDRTATITRATWLERQWTRLTGDFDFMELCEFSFSEEVRL
jgi:hypothetical protein